MENNCGGMFQFHNTAFRLHPSYNCNSVEMKRSESLSNSPNLSNENSSSILSENETCRTIVSLLINQRKANLGLEQQLKDLQSTTTTNHSIKDTTSQSPITTLTNSIHQSNTNNEQQQQRNFTFHNYQHHFSTHSSGLFSKISNLFISVILFFRFIIIIE
jgi:hypothetical protein